MAGAARISVLVSFGSIAGVSWWSYRELGFSDLFALKVTLISLLWGAVIIHLAKKHLQSCSFGAANCITLVRAALTSFLLGIVAESPSVAAGWCVAATAFVVLCLDGVDGWIARRNNAATPFGARFDMETDALLILAVSAIAWRFDKAGPWILAAGLMRYMFVSATLLLPWMKRPLPESHRRKTVFVVQAISLILSLVPLVASPFSSGVALAGLVLLSGSFATDVAWLWRARPVRAVVAVTDRG